MFRLYLNVFCRYLFETWRSVGRRRLPHPLQAVWQSPSLFAGNRPRRYGEWAVFENGPSDSRSECPRTILHPSTLRQRVFKFPSFAVLAERPILCLRSPSSLPRGYLKYHRSNPFASQAHGVFHVQEPCVEKSSRTLHRCPRWMFCGGVIARTRAKRGRMRRRKGWHTGIDRRYALLHLWSPASSAHRCCAGRLTSPPHHSLLTTLRPQLSPPFLVLYSATIPRGHTPNEFQTAGCRPSLGIHRGSVPPYTPSPPKRTVRTRRSTQNTPTDWYTAYTKSRIPRRRRSSARSNPAFPPKGPLRCISAKVPRTTAFRCQYMRIRYVVVRTKCEDAAADCRGDIAGTRIRPQECPLRGGFSHLRVRPPSFGHTFAYGT